MGKERLKILVSILQKRKNKRMQNHLNKDQTILEIKDHCKLCPRCQIALQTVSVNGHLECLMCKTIIEDCCQTSASK